MIDTVPYLDKAPAPTEAQLKKIEQLEQEAKDALRREEDSFQRCDTDGFLSQWANRMTADLNRKKIELLKNGGYHQFPVLVDTKTGEVVADHMYTFQDKFAPEWTGSVVKRWKVHAEVYGKTWIPVGSKSRIQKKLGLHEEYRWFPAYAEITTGGRKSTGLSGCANAFVGVFKKKEGFFYD